MIVLDTNVISELMRPEPAARVEEWLDRQDGGSVYFTAIGAAELRTGIAILPAGRRREALANIVSDILDVDFAGRVLPFDDDAARAYAEIASIRRAGGRPISQFDCQIAAIVRISGATLATRNIQDFADCGITLIDPWQG